MPPLRGGRGKNEERVQCLYTVLFCISIFNRPGRNTGVCCQPVFWPLLPPPLPPPGQCGSNSPPHLLRALTQLWPALQPETCWRPGLRRGGHWTGLSPPQGPALEWGLHLGNLGWLGEPEAHRVPSNSCPKTPMPVEIPGQDVLLFFDVERRPEMVSIMCQLGCLFA